MRSAFVCPGIEPVLDSITEKTVAGTSEKLAPQTLPEPMAETELRDAYDADTDTWYIYAVLEDGWLIADWDELTESVRVVFDRNGRPFGLMLKEPESGVQNQTCRYR